MDELNKKALEPETKSIFSVKVQDEERWYENTSGLDAEALCKAYGECEKPLVEMEQYGRRIGAGEFASIQQGNMLDFSVEFDEDMNEIAIFDGNQSVCRNKIPRLFVDMDGTLAEFKTVDTLETLYEKGYFLNLEPNQNIVDSVKLIIASGKCEVFIMSSVLSDSEFALQEKNAWLDKYLPEIPSERRIFPACGTDKKLAVPQGIHQNDYLMDDYSQNLTLWCPPGEGIKAMNGINGTHGTWQGNRINYDSFPQTIAHSTLAMMGLEEALELPSAMQDIIFSSGYTVNGNKILVENAVYDVLSGQLQINNGPCEPKDVLSPQAYDDLRNLIYSLKGHHLNMSLNEVESLIQGVEIGMDYNLSIPDETLKKYTYFTGSKGVFDYKEKSLDEIQSIDAAPGPTVEVHEQGTDLTENVTGESALTLKFLNTSYEI